MVTTAPTNTPTLASAATATTARMQAVKPSKPALLTVAPVVPAQGAPSAPHAATMANVPLVVGYTAGATCPVTGLHVRVPGSYRFVALAVLRQFGTCPANQYTEAHIAACNAVAQAYAGHKRMGGMGNAEWQLQLHTLAMWCRRSKWALPHCPTPAPTVSA